MTKAEVIKIQHQLRLAGWPVQEDGIYGPETHDAYQSWLNANTPAAMPTPAPRAATPWWRHKVVLGLLATVLAGATAKWGVEANELTEILLKLAEAAGLILAAWGTTPAQSRPVDVSLVAPGVRYPTHAPGVPSERNSDRPAGPFGY